MADRDRSALDEKQLEKVREHLCRLATLVTKPTRYGFQTLRRDREDGAIEYQIFADTKGSGTQIAYVQSTKHDAEFIAECLEQAPLFEQLLHAEATLQSQAQEIASLRALLSRLGHHEEGCAIRRCATCHQRATYDSVNMHYDKGNPAYHEVDPNPCDCGLAEALASRPSGGS